MRAMSAWDGSADEAEVFEELFDVVLVDVFDVVSVVVFDTVVVEVLGVVPSAGGEVLVSSPMRR